ncbi:DUF4328 domain-containing protein [Streptomyces sp. NPDC054887]
MLCANCGQDKVTTGEGLCDGCAVAAANAAPPPVAPSVPLSAGPPPSVPLSAGPAVPRSPVGLAKAVTVLLGAVVAADVFSLIVSMRARGMWSDLTSEGFTAVPVDDLERVDSQMTYASVAYGGAFLVTAVVFIVWFFRVRKNADVFAPDLQRKGRGWAIGSWFVPIGNFWLPRGVAVDVWAASRQDPYGLNARKEEPHTVLTAWWTLWVVSALFSRFAVRRYAAAEEPAAIRDALDQLIVADLLDIASAVLAILFVRALTRMQRLKAEARSAASTERPSEALDAGRI